MVVSMMVVSVMVVSVLVVLRAGGWSPCWWFSVMDIRLMAHVLGSQKLHSIVARMCTLCALYLYQFGGLSVLQFISFSFAVRVSN
jgi:hypothetical protein